MHHNDRYDSVKTKCLGKIELNAKMLSADRKNFWRYKVDFLHGGTYQLKLQTDDVILHEWGQTCPRRVLGNNHVHSVATCFFFLGGGGLP